MQPWNRIFLPLRFGAAVNSILLNRHSLEFIKSAFAVKEALDSPLSSLVSFRGVLPPHCQQWWNGSAEILEYSSFSAMRQEMRSRCVVAGSVRCTSSKWSTPCGEVPPFVTSRAALFARVGGGEWLVLRFCRQQV